MEKLNNWKNYSDQEKNELIAEWEKESQRLEDELIASNTLSPLLKLYLLNSLRNPPIPKPSYLADFDGDEINTGQTVDNKAKHKQIRFDQRQQNKTK